MRNRNPKWVGVTLVYHVSRNGEAAVDGPAKAGRSFPQSFHQALLGPTGAHWLDDPPDLTCKHDTRQHAVDDPLMPCKQVLCSSSSGGVSSTAHTKWPVLRAAPAS